MMDQALLPGEGRGLSQAPAPESAKTLWIARILPWVCLALRLGLAFLFIYAGLTKLMDPKAFARVISPYGLVPDGFLPVVAVGLPLLETLAGIALAFDVKGSLAVISGLLAMFAFVLWYGALRDLSIDCGCFGHEEIASQGNLRRAFHRDLGLMGVPLFLYVARWLGVRSKVFVYINKWRKETGR
jgi:uncharacterized membrane protein YphA (DoxX/SURF4 family)